jgi:hypothetical protein
MDGCECRIAPRARYKLVPDTVTLESVEVREVVANV